MKSTVHAWIIHWFHWNIYFGLKLNRSKFSCRRFKTTCIMKSKENYFFCLTLIWNESEGWLLRYFCTYNHGDNKRWRARARARLPRISISEARHAKDSTMCVRIASELPSERQSYNNACTCGFIAVPNPIRPPLKCTRCSLFQEFLATTLYIIFLIFVSACRKLIVYNIILMKNAFWTDHNSQSFIFH